MDKVYLGTYYRDIYRTLILPIAHTKDLPEVSKRSNLINIQPDFLCYDIESQEMVSVVKVFGVYYTYNYIDRNKKYTSKVMCKSYMGDIMVLYDESRFIKSHHPLRITGLLNFQLKSRYANINDVIDMRSYHDKRSMFFLNHNFNKMGVFNNARNSGRKKNITVQNI